jgi:hypothetical protein
VCGDGGDGAAIAASAFVSAAALDSVVFRGIVIIIGSGTREADNEA